MSYAQDITKNLGSIVDSMGSDSFRKQYPGADANRRSLGVILDEFSMQCFSPEADLWPISVRDLEMALDELKPELMLIESAWSGNDGDWTYQITSPTGPKPAFYRLIEACRQRSIPTVFWNKEDPPHFEEFLSAAKAADHIFTCEQSLIESYAKASGHNNVDTLRFAAQPRIHTPFRSDESRQGNVAFAGQYFAHKFPERREQMDMLFPAASQLGLSIYSRVVGGDPNYAFPSKYERHIVGSLPYSAMVQAYGHHKVFLNVNSVPNSESMCARRIFELSASKTAVVSAATPAISSSYAADEVFTVDSDKAAREILRTLVENDDFRERATHRAWRRTLKEHTYTNRLQEILTKLDRPAPVADTSVTALCLATTQDSLKRLACQIREQVLQPSLVVVANLRGGLFDDKFNITDIEALIGCKLVQIDNLDRISDLNLGGEFFTIFSERYDYAPNYISDMHLYMKHLSTVDIVAKGTTGDVVKSPQDYMGKSWPEDTMTTDIVAGGWMAPRGSDWRELLVHEASRPETVCSLSRRVHVSDRFNIRKYSEQNSSSWIA